MAENITETARLLVVSRESAVLRPLWSVAEPNSWQVETAVSAWDAIERLQSGATPNLLLLDLPRGDDDCMRILRWMRRLRPDLPVIVMCSPEDAGRKKEATRLGAQEVLLKPFDESRLEAAIQRHLVRSSEEDAEFSSEHIEQLGPDSFFVSASPSRSKASRPGRVTGRGGCSGAYLRGDRERQGYGCETDPQAVRSLRVSVPQSELRGHAG